MSQLPHYTKSLNVSADLLKRLLDETKCSKVALIVHADGLVELRGEGGDFSVWSRYAGLSDDISELGKADKAYADAWRLFILEPRGLEPIGK